MSRYHRTYAMLKRAGYTAARAIDIIAAAMNADAYAMLRIRNARELGF